MARKQLKTLKNPPPPAGSKTLLTILMPLYNQEPYIRAALDSILMQETNYKYQLIINDDASTDNSLKIAKEYQAKYPNIIKIFIIVFFPAGGGGFLSVFNCFLAIFSPLIKRVL